MYANYFLSYAKYFLDLPTVILEPDVGSLEYQGEDTLLSVTCLVTDAAPVAGVTWIKVGQTSVYSTETSITVGTNNTGEFLCTALNTVGPSLTASLMVQIKGEFLGFKQIFDMFDVRFTEEAAARGCRLQIQCQTPFSN